MTKLLMQTNPIIQPNRPKIYYKRPHIVLAIMPNGTSMKTLTLVGLAVVCGGAMGDPAFGIKVYHRYVEAFTSTVQWVIEF